MLADDVTVLNIKHEVLYEVAKMAYAKNLKEGKELLPYQMIPGPKARFRCCIYKEREIIRQRVRLVEGKCPSDKNSDSMIQVISSACEECSISRYVVTDNCRKCMKKACQQACRFGAISMGTNRAHIDPDKCKECGLCSKSCPYNAIADLMRPCKRACPVDAMSFDEYGICVIDEDKCIQCGHCIHSCPFGAIGSKTFIVNIINDMLAGKPVYAMVAPATEGQFGKDISMTSIREALKKIGFKDMIEVGLGGDMTAAAEAEEWAEAYKEGKKMTTSCCPAFVNMIKKHFPELWENVSTTVSPMCAVSRMIKAKEPDAVTVFIGPCVAKKAEIQDKSIEGNADYVLTYGEMRAMLKARDVQFEPAANDTQEASIYGKKFANAGGVTAAVVKCLEEMDENADLKVRTCNGAAECKAALTLLKLGRLPEDFIEGMVCEGGCVGGPSRHRSERESMKDRNALLGEADERGVHENLEHYAMDSFSMHR
ncbi:MAG: 4Fe-4S dicluster domain-containing protein [Lachnospiraceae bacterium]|nr:4Fe-4S dicluster domain-containing protein [Lachnospiraceae bacterium]